MTNSKVVGNDEGGIICTDPRHFLPQMALFSSSPRSRSLSDQVLIQKIEKAEASSKMAQLCDQFGDSDNNVDGGIKTKPSQTQKRGAGDASDSNDPLIPSDRSLMRNFSVESNTSVGSSFGEDVCHCDDCFLGITDLYFVGSKSTTSTKKVSVRSYYNGPLLLLVSR